MLLDQAKQQHQLSESEGFVVNFF